jgi:hypothetical protein
VRVLGPLMDRQRTVEAAVSARRRDDHVVERVLPVGLGDGLHLR